MRGRERSKLPPVVIFSSIRRVFQIARGLARRTERRPEHLTGELPTSLAQLSLRGDSNHRWHPSSAGFNPRWESVAAEQTLFGTSLDKGSSRKTRPTPCAPSLQSERRS